MNSVRSSSKTRFPIRKQGLLRLRSAYSVTLFVDDQKVGSVQRHGEEIFELSAGWHTIQIQEQRNLYHWPLRSQKIDLMVDSETELVFECVATPFSSRMLMLALPLCLCPLLVFISACLVQFHVVGPNSTKNLSDASLFIPALIAFLLLRKPGAVFKLTELYE
jgi:hypothetical protein